MSIIFRNTFGAIALALFTANVHAGFCDNQGAQQIVTDVHLFAGKAYVKFKPGLVAGGEAENCNRNIISLDMASEHFDTYYSTVLTALASGKTVQFSYCGPCAAHAYEGPSIQVAPVTGLRLRK